jgi:hypothetical protein
MKIQKRLISGWMSIILIMLSVILWRLIQLIMGKLTKTLEIVRWEDILMGYLISETTKEEREQIVKESLGNIDANCDGCMAGLAQMYQDYIDGKKELREINMEFNARYVKDDDMPRRVGCGYAN